MTALLPSCYDCGRTYASPGFPDLVIPKEAWSKISPSGDEGGLLCPSCICARLDISGIKTTGIFTSGPLSYCAPLTPAARDVLAERDRQISQEGWTPEHDDAHTEGELAKAAGCYAWIAAQSDRLRAAFDRPPPTWPVEWDEDWWKVTNRRRDLVKAGALILAEIDRLDRAAAANRLASQRKETET